VGKQLVKCAGQIDGLRADIRSGKLRPGVMVGTEFAFSQQWDMSRNTVRRGIEQLVEEGLLERRPGKGLFVRSPATAFRNIQVVVPDLRWSHVVSIARGAQEAGRAVGVRTQVYDAHGDIESDLEVIRQMHEGPMDGAIIVSMHHRRFAEVLFGLKQVGFPFVLVDEKLRDLDVPSVRIDSYKGGYCIGQKLAEQGHKRILFLGPTSLYTVQERLNGFRDAILDAGILFDRSLVIDPQVVGLSDWLGGRFRAVEGAFLQLLKSDNPPTAIVDGSGDVAPLIYRWVRKLGLRIPQDVSVVTFDDAATFTELLGPTVAQLKHPWEELGKAALDMLVGQMSQAKRGGRSGREDLVEDLVLQSRWVSGESLAPCRLST
jgi:DNA-binding LacI/PurR family transcriptional regulator